MVNTNERMNFYMEKSIIEAKMISKSYSNQGVMQHVLTNLNISIEEGEFVTIMGNSGSGKSTLLNVLSGLDNVTLGEVLFNGENISKFSLNKMAVFRRKSCGFVFQQNYLDHTMSILDNVLVSGLLTNKNKKEIVNKAKDLFEKVGIDKSLINKFPAQLSGGEQQRVCIVRALINKPLVVFADEPTGALNSTSGKRVLDVFSNEKEDGQTIVMVTHDFKSALRADRILYLKDGVIISQLLLGSYSEEEKEVRTKKLQYFLDEMGW